MVSNRYLNPKNRAEKGEEIIGCVSTRPPSYTAQLEQVERAKFADKHCKQLLEVIKDFEKTLNDNEEVALMLPSFGQSVVLAVKDIAFQNPSQLRFFGKVDGVDSVLVQHVSQLNLLLISTPKATPNQPPRRIGFILEEENADMDCEAEVSP